MTETLGYPVRLVEGNSGKTLMCYKDVTVAEYQMLLDYVKIMRKKADEARAQFKREHPGIVGAELQFATEMMNAAHPYFYLTNERIVL